MTWRDNLRPGSFRGVRFHTSSRGFKTGRALVKHEYPKRDTPYIEDMGLDTEQWSGLDVYVIGDDYMSRRDALVAACRKAGAGSYTDHWGRSGLVKCESCELKEESQQGRMARFTLSFLPAGAGTGLAGVVATAAVLGSAAGGLLGAVVLNFAATGLVGQSMASLAKVPGLDSLARLAGGISSAAVTSQLAPSLAGLAGQAASRAAGGVLSVPLPQFAGTRILLPTR